MPKFNSLPSFQRYYPETVEERDPDFSPLTPSITDPFSLPITDPFVPANVFPPSSQAHLEVDPTTGQIKFDKEIAPRATDQLLSPTGVVHDIPTTQSLITALQSTMVPSPSARRGPVVIPGSRKRSRKSQKTGPERRLNPRLRWGVVLGAIFAVTAMTLLSLTPIGSDGNKSTIFSGVVQWVHAQDQNWSLTEHVVAILQQNSPAAPSLPANPPPVNLPKSQYVAMARQAAINAGINPDYFVRQINQESGFRPDAVSPSGAVGIAQFMPATAAGLGINPYDPVSALNGAARYMANLAGQYGGDYAKALAAYNAGGGTVQNAIRLGGSNWMNYLPAETRHYIYIVVGV